MDNDRHKPYNPAGLISSELYAEKIIEQWKNEMTPLNQIKHFFEAMNPYFLVIILTLLIYIPFGLLFAYLAVHVATGN